MIDGQINGCNADVNFRFTAFQAHGRVRGPIEAATCATQGQQKGPAGVRLSLRDKSGAEVLKTGHDHIMLLNLVLLLDDLLFPTVNISFFRFPRLCLPRMVRLCCNQSCLQITPWQPYTIISILKTVLRY